MGFYTVTDRDDDIKVVVLRVIDFSHSSGIILPSASG
jgi:hypothetical protein